LRIKKELKHSTGIKKPSFLNKVTNLKGLPKIFHDSPSSSPLKSTAQQNLYVAYRKKKMQVNKLRE
jgi:hypothetical protein